MHFTLSIFNHILVLMLFSMYRQTILSPKQPNVIEEKVTADRITISWDINVPPSTANYMFKIYVVINNKEEVIAKKFKDSTLKLSPLDDLLEIYRNRIEVLNNQIVLSKINFEQDHGSIFYATIDYDSDTTKSFERSENVNLIINYPPQFVNVEEVSGIIEGTSGELTCTVKSFPESTVHWDLESISGDIKFRTESFVLSSDDIGNIGENSDTKLKYSKSVLKYINISRHAPKNISCYAIYPKDIQRATNNRTLDILFPASPPVNVEVKSTTDSEANIQWKNSGDNGNPARVVLYSIEFVKIDTIIPESAPPQFRHVKDLSNQYIGEEGYKRRKLDTIKTKKIRSNEQEREWNIYNSSTEEAILFNLDPNSKYTARVKTFNGVTYSKPSREIIFTTEPKKTKPGFTITQPILIGIIAGSSVVALILMCLTVVCVIKIKKRRQTAWAIFNQTKLNKSHDEEKKTKKEESMLEEVTSHSSFANIPPPIINTTRLGNYVPRTYTLNEINRKNSFQNDKEVLPLNRSISDMQTQIATKYITSSRGSTNASRSNLSDIHETKLFDDASHVSQKSAYV